MYRLLLLFTFFSSLKINAQNKPDYSQLLKQKLSALKDQRRFPLGQLKIDAARNSNITAFLSNPKPGVHRLRQDNMPCLVPDPTATVAMPNVWKGKIGVPFESGLPRIPNPVKPLTLSPSRPLLITPDTK